MKLLLVFNKFCRALGAPIFRFKVVGAAHHSQLQTACKNDALLVEAERLASLGSWEHNLVTGEEVWSANLCQMLGVDPTRTIVSEDLFWKLLHPGDLEAVRCKIEWAMKDRQPFEYRARFILPDGRERVIFARGKLIVDSQNHIVKRIGVTQDITLRVESQKALRESEARFETLFGSIDEIVSEIDSEGKYVNVWCRDESLLPCPKEQILGSTISELFGEEFFAPVEVVVRQVLETGKGENFEYSTVVHGTTHWFLGRMTPIPSADGTKRTLCFLARDITERKRTEDALRRLSASLIDAQDQERRRIAGELHENTAQGLAGMRMLLGGIKRNQRALPTSARKAIDECLTINNKIIKEIRTLSYLLYPVLLEQAGLCAAVPWYAAGFSKRSGIQIQVEVPNEISPLPQEHETTLFRIMQECLLNVYRHSGSRHARILILREDHQVSMEVEDQGKGLTAPLDGGSACKTPLGVGIVGMRERVRQSDGSFFIESKPGKGVTVRVVLPVKIGVGRRRNAQTSRTPQTMSSSAGK